jgi:glutaconyl-CoA/methylmalonyl-CoA decarboxylase subunit gamma
MKYFVTLAEGAEPRVVDVTELPSGELQVTLDGKSVDVDVMALDKTLSVRIDGQVIDLSVEGNLPDLGAVASGHRSYVRVESERARAAAASKRSGGTTDKVVKSPMPGRVVKINVAVGDEVAIGQPLMVVEAMKMENELKAKLAGKVAELFVVAGATVEANGRLLSFE